MPDSAVSSKKGAPALSAGTNQPLLTQDLPEIAPVLLYATAKKCGLICNVSVTLLLLCLYFILTPLFEQAVDFR